MNDCRFLNVAGAHLSTLELEHLLKLELAKLGLNHFVLMVINANQDITYQYVSGFGDEQMQVYQQHMEHDVFFQHYASSGYQGQFLYLQEMLPMRKIRNPIFNDILVPTMQLYHSYSGLTPLMDNHYLMLSSHGDHLLDYRNAQRVDTIWQFLKAWGNYWVAQRKMSAQLNQFESATKARLITSNLTSAEMNVLNLLANGLDGSEVAQQRNVSKETVRSQIKQILHKTGCKHQNQLLTRYFRSGIQDQNEFITLSPQLTKLI